MADSIRNKGKKQLCYTIKNGEGVMDLTSLMIWVNMLC